MISYLDTSAALKLLIEEVESTSIADHLNRALDAGRDIVSSMLLFTELHCAAARRGGISEDAVNSVLDVVALVDLDRADLTRAATSAWGLRSADAIHLAAALRLDVDTMLTYDVELARTARRAGIRVEAPAPSTQPRSPE
ncbi:type II toxin-antitoxin system VapC family toxin [Ornithinimicrobium ciconiae]|uniref:Type II toxin-antitoxin system VapC family toxin n=1 Tax=Ornithinimicrobium ciconiae TaxID=2594265 RepID=A0A516GC03_9MICO|nr:type II toxin-antitoxin system VapC family toxin [Ornithinimicrobium ciconiae]QDO89066.1 type II toxin-antitoxin system VapC family toxin [Ornithinimicrobium ciconiae]